jgi:hypothetical protein
LRHWRLCMTCPRRPPPSELRTYSSPQLLCSVQAAHFYFILQKLFLYYQKPGSTSGRCFSLLRGLTNSIRALSARHAGASASRASRWSGTASRGRDGYQRALCGIAIGEPFHIGVCPKYLQLHSYELVLVIPLR